MTDIIDIEEQNVLAARSLLESVPTLLDEHPYAIPEVLLPGGYGRVIVINETA